MKSIKEKLISVLLTLSMTVSFFATMFTSVNASVSVPSYSCGDVDGNGTIAIADALEILKSLAKMSSAVENGGERALKAATFQSKGTSPAISDVLEILKLLAKMNSYFSAHNADSCTHCNGGAVSTDSSDTTTSETTSSAATSNSATISATSANTTVSSSASTSITSATSSNTSVSSATSTSVTSVTSSNTTVSSSASTSVTSATSSNTTASSSASTSITSATSSSATVSSATSTSVTSATSASETVSSTASTSSTSATSASETVPSSASTSGTSATSSSATVGVIRYTITLNTNGGTLPADAQPSYRTSSGTAPGVLTTRLPEPTLSGHTFAGWFTAQTGGTQVISGTSTGTVFDNDATVWARWTPISQPTGGFSVSGTKLLDANGTEFIMRGVNHAHTWFKGERNTALTAIAATGSNTVRIVLSNGRQWTKDSQAEVQWLVNRCKELGMVAVLEIHDATGRNDEADLMAAVDYWIEIKDVLIGNEAYVIVNIANEWYGDWNTAGWRNGYLKAIPALRNAGIKNTLMVDCAGWGQYPQSLFDGGKAVFEADTLANTMFSIHMYEYAGGTSAMVRDNIDRALALNVPLVIGEFGHKHTGNSVTQDVAFQEILAYCKEKSVGYLGWSWKGNGSPVEYLDIAITWNGSTLSSDWGEILINHATNGIKATSVRATVFNSPTTTIAAIENNSEQDSGESTRIGILQGLQENIPPTAGITVMFTIGLAALHLQNRRKKARNSA